MESGQEESAAFRLLNQEEYEKLSQDEKVAYVNRAIRVLTFRETTVAIIKPPEEEK